MIQSSWLAWATKTRLCLKREQGLSGDICVAYHAAVQCQLLYIVSEPGPAAGNLLCVARSPRLRVGQN